MGETKNTGADRDSLNIPVWKKVTLSIEEAAAYSGIGKLTLRSELQRADCPFRLKIGRRYLIKREKFEDFLNSHVQL